MLKPPMSSPQITRMFGFFAAVWARAGDCGSERGDERRDEPG